MIDLYAKRQNPIKPIRVFIQTNSFTTVLQDLYSNNTSFQFTIHGFDGK